MGSWKIGKAFGIDIFVHWSFFLLFVYLSFDSQGEEFGPGVLHRAILVTLLFGCVVLHELGHALMARRFGVGTRDITLYPIGGIARLERMPERPFEEICVALAGPAVNVVIAGLLMAPLLMRSALRESFGTELEALVQGDLLTGLLIGNIGLVLFNLLPVFPSDGGRVLRALLVTPFGRVQATRIAATVGAIAACLFMVFAVLNQAWLGIVVALFLFMAGQQELAYVQFQARQAARRNLFVADDSSDVLDVLPVPVETTFSGAQWDQHRQVWVLWQNGRPVRTFWMPGSQG
jgi:Zn-dependent protease